MTPINHPGIPLEISILTWRSYWDNTHRKCHPEKTNATFEKIRFGSLRKLM